MCFERTEIHQQATVHHLQSRNINSFSFRSGVCSLQWMLAFFRQGRRSHFHCIAMTKVIKVPWICRQNSKMSLTLDLSLYYLEGFPSSCRQQIIDGKVETLSISVTNQWLIFLKWHYNFHGHGEQHIKSPPLKKHFPIIRVFIRHLL